MRMSPLGRGCSSNPATHGDINNERKRTGTLKDHGGRDGAGVDAGGGGWIDGRVLSAEQAYLAAVSGRWRCGPGASVARSSVRFASGSMPPVSAVALADDRLAIAKFPKPDDTRAIAAGEILALTLAEQSGIQVAEHRLVSLGGKTSPSSPALTV